MNQRYAIAGYNSAGEPRTCWETFPSREAAQTRAAAINNSPRPLARGCRAVPATAEHIRRFERKRELLR